MSIINEITKTTWLTDSSTLAKLYDIANRDSKVIELVERYESKPFDNAYLTKVRDDVAIINVRGVIMRYGNMFTKVCGAASLDVIATEFQYAIDDDSITSIIFNIDSPGGSATGINEFAEHIYNSRGIKPIKAYVGGMCASAAYFIASACDEIVVDEMSMVGSIGTVVVIDKQDDNKIEIVSNKSPNKRLDADSDEGMAKIRTMLDDMTDVFLSKVSRNRCMDIDSVITAGDKGGVIIGAKAVTNKLADRLGNFESLINELNIATQTVAGGMMNKPDEPTINADAELSAESIASETMQKERARVNAILDLNSVGAEDIVMNAIKTGATVEDTAIKVVAQLKAMQQEQKAEDTSLYVKPLAEEVSESVTIEQQADELCKLM